MCYTFVAPAEVHNRADDKGPGPHAAHCGLENNVEAVKGLIPLRRWQVGPSSKPGDPFLHWAGSPSDSGGKTWAAHHHRALAQSVDWDAIVRGEYYLHCRAVVVFVVSEDDAPAKGSRDADGACVSAAGPDFFCFLILPTTLLTTLFHSFHLKLISNFFFFVPTYWCG